MKNFILVGMKSPGRINLQEFGTVELETISDALAEKIWRSGCRYLQPTSEYRKILFPEEKPIQITPLKLVNTLPAANPADTLPGSSTGEVPATKRSRKQL